ncbi:MAG: hypothetical protein U1E14_07775 [Geminicoccaceae bacterium]
MRLALIGAGLLAAGVLAPPAMAQDTTTTAQDPAMAQACDKRMDDASQRILNLPIPTRERVRYLSFLVGAYERCNANDPDAWRTIDAYLADK